MLAFADVFVLSSVEEGLPTVVIEAMALGKPVISTSVGGIPEIISNGVNGLLVPPRAPKILARAIEKVLENPALGNKLGEEAARSVADYPWEEIADKYDALYQSLLGFSKRSNQHKSSPIQNN
jgi:starch synthase